MNSVNSVICTLSEKSYHCGVGALANSLYSSGFRGKFFCGYRGALPMWANNLQEISKGVQLYKAADGLDIYFLKQETQRHFTLHKPRFMLELMSGLASDAEQIFYFDPDIVVKCPWEFIEIWPRGGVALCEDEFSSYSGVLPERHPLRLLWTQWLEKTAKLSVVSSCDRYYNAGFVGIERANISFLKLWAEIIEKVCAQIGTDREINFGPKASLFYIPDQHALNMALMCAETPINAAGIDGMDFGPKGFLLSHAVRSPKPWMGGFLRRALFGKKPRESEIQFVKYLQRPIQVFSPFKTWWLKASLKLAREISRF